jgi:hypothetical protein
MFQGCRRRVEASIAAESINRFIGKRPSFSGVPMLGLTDLGGIGARPGENNTSNNRQVMQ